MHARKTRESRRQDRSVLPDHLNHLGPFVLVGRLFRGLSPRMLRRLRLPRGLFLIPEKGQRGRVFAGALLPLDGCRSEAVRENLAWIRGARGRTLPVRMGAWLPAPFRNALFPGQDAHPKGMLRFRATPELAQHLAKAWPRLDQIHSTDGTHWNPARVSDLPGEDLTGVLLELTALAQSLEVREEGLQLGLVPDLELLRGPDGLGWGWYSRWPDPDDLPPVYSWHSATLPDPAEVLDHGEAQEATPSWVHHGGGWIDFNLTILDRTFTLNLSNVYDPLPDLADWIQKSRATDGCTVVGIDQEGRDGMLALRPAEESGTAWLQIFGDSLEHPLGQARVNRARFLRDLSDSMATFLRTHPELDQWPLHASEWRPYRERILIRLDALPEAPSRG